MRQYRTADLCDENQDKKIQVLSHKFKNYGGKKRFNGFVRDTMETKKFNIGLFALGTCPLRNFDKTPSQLGIDLYFGNISFKEDDYIYCDEDGIIVSNEKLM